MLKMSAGPSGEPFSVMVIVAFDPTKGDVFATCAHAYGGETDDVGIARSREQLLKDVQGRLGSCTNIELVQIHLAELEEGCIERIDPTTRTVVIRSGRDSATCITRP